MLLFDKVISIAILRERLLECLSVVGFADSCLTSSRSICYPSGHIHAYGTYHL